MKDQDISPAQAIYDNDLNSPLEFKSQGNTVSIADEMRMEMIKSQSKYARKPSQDEKQGRIARMAIFTTFIYVTYEVVCIISYVYVEKLF